MDSDDLGQKGQAKFQELCADASLICNPSTYDRAGWDFIVEFRYEGPGPLENRSAPPSCQVQVKTILDKNDTIQLRLSSAERLAKELRPSFIYVLKIGEDLNPTSAFLIHIKDEALGKILKRLRKEDTAGTLAANKQYITFSVKKYGVPLEVRGAALRTLLIEACGANFDLARYAAEKKEQLEKLGFEERPYELRMTLPGTLSEVVDTFLGLRKNARALNLHTVLTRFGITVPVMPGGEEGTVTFQPHPVDTCTVTLRGNDVQTPPAAFEAEVFTTPPVLELPPEQQKIVFRTRFFSLVLLRDAFEIVPADDIPPQTPAAWASFYRFYLIAVAGGTLRLTSHTHQTDSMLEIAPQQFEDFDLKRCQFAHKVCEAASDIFSRNRITEPELPRQALFEVSDRILRVYNLLRPENGPTIFQANTEDNEALPSELTTDALYVDILEIGDHRIAFAGVMKLNGRCDRGRFHWSAEDIVLKPNGAALRRARSI